MLSLMYLKSVRFSITISRSSWISFSFLQIILFIISRQAVPSFYRTNGQTIDRFGRCFG
jgi:hypothetical protein